MTSVFRSGSIAAAAAGSVAMALLLSGGASQAQAQLQEGINNVTGTVVVGGEMVGRDPDIGIRFSLLKGHGSLVNGS